MNNLNEIAFSQPVVNIGADGGNDIVLRGSDIADFHAMLNYDSGIWNLVPLDRSFPTLVNGRGIDPSGCTLHSGCVLSIGTYRLTLSLNGVNMDIQIRTNTGDIVNNAVIEESLGQNILLTLDGVVPTEVETNGVAEYQLVVTNAGPLVANMQLQVQGIPTSWVQIIPPVINLNEGRKGSFTVRINPPRSPDSKAGLYSLHFVAISPNYSGETGTADAVLNVLPYSEFMVSGPVPRRLTISRKTKTDFTDVVIINQANSPASFMVRSYDDGNELLFSHGGQGAPVEQGQNTVTVQPGDNMRLPLQVGARKLPLIGFSSKTHYYYTNVTPIDQPGDTQSVAGEVVVKPLINALKLILIILLIILIAGIVLLPRISAFHGVSGKQIEVIQSGSSAWVTWDVSAFASKVTLDSGNGPEEVERKRTSFISPVVSTTYTLKAENFISNLLHLNYEKEFKVMVIPDRPKIDVFRTDRTQVNYNDNVTLSWSVGQNSDSASLVKNKQETILEPEKYSGDEQGPFTTDTLLSMRVENSSGYEIKSLFVNVKPERIDLTRYIVWVRPSGMAVPNNNDVGHAIRWSSLQLMGTPVPTPQAFKPAGVSRMPARQSNVLEIPDNFTSGTSAYPQNPNPEQLGQTGPLPGMSFYPPAGPAAGTELLVGPGLNPTPTPTAVITAEAPVVEIHSQPQVIATAPASSPERSSVSREFSIKLMEVVEDSSDPNGYRVIDYFPDYTLQKGEQVMIEWMVDGVSTVKISNLSNDPLGSSGAEYAYPEKSVNYVLEAETGTVKKAFSMPLRVAGDADDGAGSGKNCELKANATELTVPGTVMLTWTGGGNNRVQLVSSAKAEKDTAEAEKKAEEEAKAKGESYTKKENQPMTGGIIGDYLQSAGFMRVDVDKQTTFVLNVYDGGGNIICTKNAEVKLKGGNDKKSFGSGFKIIKIADANDISWEAYGLGSTVYFTVQFTGYDKGKEPTGSVSVTDGTSTCTITLPATTCSFQTKKVGVPLKVTASYSGDDNYTKGTATSSYNVIEKLDTVVTIADDTTISDLRSNGLIPNDTEEDLPEDLLKPYKPEPLRANLDVLFKWFTMDEEGNEKMGTDPIYSRMPTGTLTFIPTDNKGTDYGKCECDAFNCSVDTFSCDGDISVETFSYFEDYSVTGMLLSNAAIDRIRVEYSGDDLFKPAKSSTVLFWTVPTTFSVINPILTSDGYISLTADIKPDEPGPEGRNVTGKITFRSGATGSSSSHGSGDSSVSYTAEACDLTFDRSTYKFENCSGDAAIECNSEGECNIKITNMMMNGTPGENIIAVYSGDSLYQSATSPTSRFNQIRTDTMITDEVETLNDFTVTLSWIDPSTISPAGTIAIDACAKNNEDESACNVCYLSVDTGKFKEGCSGNVSKSAKDHSNVFVIKGMTFPSGTAYSIQAFYSGDSSYLESESQPVYSKRTDTKIEITKAYKISDILANLTAVLTWDETAAGENIPGGTITFTSMYSGGDFNTCTYDIDEKKWSCDGDISEENYIFTLEEFPLTDSRADRIRVDYNGDENFNPSTSTMTLFTKIGTEIAVTKAHKTAADSDVADVSAILYWNKNLAEGRKPTGKVQFIVGTGTCTLDIETKKLDCDPKEGGVDFDYVTDIVDVNEYDIVMFSVKNMLISDKTADRVYVKYLGDTFFGESESTKFPFAVGPQIDTWIDITKAYKAKADADYADITALLNWDESQYDDLNLPEGTLPTGTIQFIVGGGTCTLNIETKKLDCEPQSGSVSGDRKTYSVMNMLLADRNADRVKVKYSGDANFLPSESTKLFIFNRVITETIITDAVKTGSGVDYQLSLNWVDPVTGDVKPTGTITITAGEGTCYLDVETGEFREGCSGRVTRSGYDYTIQGMTLTDADAASIRASYSGDPNYLPSESQPVYFDRIDTEIDIRDMYKISDVLANLTAELTWDVTEAGEDIPGGTITFTPMYRGGEFSSCEYDIVNETFSCSGRISEENYVFTLENFPLADARADRIRVDYSGDVNFNPSTSTMTMLGKLETTISVTKAHKDAADSDLADVTALLGWDESLAGDRKPTGTIQFIVGTGTCTLEIDTGKMDCDPKTGSVSEDRKTYSVESMLLADKAADRVYVKYSGDAFFEASESTNFPFIVGPQIDTALTLTDAYKSGPWQANVTAILSWKKADVPEPGDQTPEGTIALTIGSETCTYNILSKAFNCTGETTEITASDAEEDPDNPERMRITWKFGKITLKDNTADRVKGDYSGDKAFKSSSSRIVMFRKTATSTSIADAEKSAEGNVSLKLTVTGAGEHPEGLKPLGTVKFTSGSKTCTLDTSEGADKARFTDCMGEVTLADDGSYLITGLEMGSGVGDTINAVYSGDSAFFEGSTSPMVNFLKLDTTLVLSGAYKPGSMLASFNASLSWTPDAEHPNRQPVGTITFTIGGDSCKYDIVSKYFSCRGQSTEVDFKPAAAAGEMSGPFNNVVLSTSTADRIQASYSGDAVFNPSTSIIVLFNTVPTQISVNRAFKTETDFADISAVLEWNESLAGGRVPSGIVKITAGSGICTLDITDIDDPQLSCNSRDIDITVNDEKNRMEIVISRMMMDDRNADRVQVSYEGDGFFTSSISERVIFDTIPTDISISNARRTQSGQVSLTADLSWMDESTTTKWATGTIKFTSGTGVCTLDITGLSPRFTDCTGSASVVRNDRNMTFTVTSMNMSGKAGDTVKAEYSGDGGFMPSVSNTLSFDRLNTTLELNSITTHKAGESLLNVEADLSWNKDEAGEQKPTGTVKYTVGGGVCTLDLQTKALDCESESITIDTTTSDENIHIVILKMLLADKTADRVKAEYSGDSVFNPSSSTVLFTTVGTSIEIINDTNYKPYRPDSGYANFNTKLTWDESEADGQTPTGTITFTTIYPDPLASSNCVYDLSSGKMDCEGNVTYVTDHYEIRRMLMNYEKADRVKAQYSGDGFFEPSSSTTVLFDMSDTATRITDAAKSSEGNVDLTVSVTATKDYPEAPRRSPKGTIRITSGSKTCTLDISMDTPRITDCEGTVVMSGESYRITGLAMGETSGNNIKADYSGDSYFRSSISPTLDFIKVNSTLVIDRAYKPGDPVLANVTATLSWIKEEAGEVKPRGSITFTIGADKCVLDIDGGTISCKGDRTKVTRTASAEGNSYTWVMENILLSGNTADRVSAEYGGDSTFNGSTSNTVMFKTVPTEIMVSKAFKTEGEYADIAAVMSWDETLADGRKPSGTVTFKAGSGSCVLDIETKVLNCEPRTGTVSDDRKTYSVSRMLLEDKAAERVQVEYSGDGFFLASTSTRVMFDTIPTSLSIYEGSRTQAGLISVKADLSWVNESPDGKKPTGTIKFTSGTAVCNLDITTLRFKDCVGTVTRTEEDLTQTYTVTNLNMGSKAGSEITAEYSGDGGYLGSVSDSLYFDKLDTDLMLDNITTHKTGESLLNVIGDLSWDPDEAGEEKPTGTVKFTVGGGVCTLDLAAKTMDCESESITVTDLERSKHIEIKGMLLADKTADRVKAEYSGDSIFNPSSSTVLFKTLETTIVIINDETYRPYRPETGYANFNVKLSWDESQAGGQMPTGTITFTTIYPDPLSSSKCVYDISSDKMDCEGKVTYKEAAGTEPAHYEIRNMLMNYAKADRVKAEYSGDGFFEPSSSTTVLFDMSDTTTMITAAAKSPTGETELTLGLTVTKDHPDGRTPIGTITITSGSKVCTLNMAEKKFNDCDGQVEVTDGSYRITGLRMGDTAGSSIKAEYSGDSYFRSSTSPTIDFVKVNTELRIDKAVKPGDPARANITATLSWSKDAAGENTPSGTITFTIGTDKCTLDIKTNTISCKDGDTVVSPSTAADGQSYTWEMTNILLSGTTADRVSAEYAGDAFFNASTSNTFLFKTVPTQVQIDNAVKTGTDYADILASLHWDNTLADGGVPKGTLKFTAGSGSCTLDISEKKLSCYSQEIPDVKVNEEKNQIDFVIKGMLLDDYNADRVQVEYSGDGFFLTSTSTKTLFTTIPTDLTISRATRDQDASGNIIIGLTSTLSWINSSPTDRIPAGTIKFTSGTKSCTLNISGETPQFDCDGRASVEKDGKKLTFTVTELNMGTGAGSDIKAEYSGDGGFLASASDPFSFDKYDTGLTVDSSLTYKTSDSTANVVADLTWAKSQVQTQKPSGIVKFTIGSGTCTLDLGTKALDCESKTPITLEDTEQGFHIVIEDMLLPDKTADRIKAEYSGDALFNASSSTALFKTVATVIEIVNDTTYKPYRPNTGYANFNTKLTWTEADANGHTPTGTITFTTIYPDPLVSSKCVYDMVTERMDCEGSVDYKDATETVPAHYEIRGMLMNYTKADRVKAEYSGDGFFLASSSTTVLFDMSDTTTKIMSAAKSPDNVVEMTVAVQTTKTHPDGKRPVGTLKITSGSKTCTLDISADSIQFTDCDGRAELTTDGNYHIIDLQMGETSGTSIKADYSGDSYFRESTSPTFDFVKLNTELNISNAHKPGANLANVDAVLSWTKADAGDKTPTGTITFTIGTETCRLDVVTKAFTCQGQRTEIDRVPAPGETVNDRFTWTLRNIMLSSTNADRIKAEYSGDAIFNGSSSMIVLFQTVPTTLAISNNTKTSEGLIGLTLDLDWTDSVPTGMVPGGTIKLTSGSATCTLSISETTAAFTDCTSDPITPGIKDKGRKYVISNLSMSNAGDTINAEYSGDGFYLASVSDTKDFTKLETKLEITNAYKPGSNLANVTSLLSWKKSEAGDKVPTGTITFTAGSDSCKLDITTRVFSCTGESTKITRDPLDDADINESLTWAIEKMILSSNNADRVQAVYSGDGIFNGSSSVIVMFKTVETTLTVSRFKKMASGFLGMDITLNWAEEPPAANLSPSGTIKLTSGTGTCTISIANNAARLTDCQGDAINVTPGDKSLTYTISHLDMDDKAGDSVKAEYSGDVVFLASVSDSVFFNKADTNLNITGAYKGDDGLANLTVALDWLEADAGDNDPTGTITFTIGSDTCRMIVGTKSFSCSGVSTEVSDPAKQTEEGKVTWTWTIKNILLSSTTADRVKADYSGDSIFNSSSSRIVLFQNVPTTLEIQPPFKTSSGLLSTNLVLEWADEPPADMVPGGTIKLTSGTATCTMTITGDADSLSFTDCQGDPVAVSKAEKSRTYEIRNLNMGDKGGDDLKAEYSGDGTFLTSTSNTVYFSKVDTKLNIDSATKAGDYLVDVTSTLTWVKADAGESVPQSGTLTLTIGSEACKLPYDLSNPEDVSGFNCAGENTRLLITRDANDPTTGSITWKLTNILLSSNSADRVKADYSGDANFNPSSSKIVLFPTVATTTTISDQVKATDGKVSFTTVLGWASTAPSGKTPTGTFKLKSGSAVCEIDISGSTPVFNSCSGEPIGSVTSGNARTFTFTNLDMGTGVGDDIKAEYSGDGVFMASASDTLYFNKVNTTLTIDRAWKYETASLASINASLTWNKADAESSTPEGTIRFTIGSETCVMDINTKSISCTGSATSVDTDVTDVTDVTPNKKKMTLTLRNVLLSGTGADRLKAEYLGDATFNPSTSTTVMFETKETSTRIESPIKKNSNKVDLTAAITWDGDVPENTVVPTGTITFTSGSKTCTLNLITKKFTNCTADPVIVNTDGKYVITNLEMGTEAGTTIKAEYSGDSYFQKSVSPTVEFTKVDTDIMINGAVKVKGGTMVNTTISLTWNKEIALGNTPTGTITIPIGSTSCKMTIHADDQENPENFSCSGDDTAIVFRNIAKTCVEVDSPCQADTELPDGKIGYRWSITNIAADASSATQITAAYSGDSIFNEDTSRIVRFTTVDTTTVIDEDETVKTGDGSMVDMKVSLKWNKEKAVSNTPTGTMTLNIGSDTCKLPINPEARESVTDFNCAGVTTKIKLEGPQTDAEGNPVADEDGNLIYTWTFKDIVLTSTTADRVKVSYSGDPIFNASSSLIVKFKTVETETVIKSHQLRPDGTVDTVLYLKWDQTKTDGLDADHKGTKPSGTIKFTAGSSSCTLRIKSDADTTEYLDPEMTDCDVSSAVIAADDKWEVIEGHEYPKFLIKGLKIGDGTAPSIKAEYSGDGLFLKSTSDEMFFKKVDTTLTVDSGVYKPTDSRVNLSSVLRWLKVENDEGSIIKPIGSITYTMGSDACKLELSTGSFTCSDNSTVVTLGEPAEDPEDGNYVKWNITFTNILLSNGNPADRVKAEFSGDKLFKPSSSDYVLFATVPTTTNILKQQKDPSGTIGATLTVEWSKNPPTAEKPGGTVKLTSGSASCTLDLADSKFTDCNNEVVTVKKTEEEKRLIFEFNGLNMGAGAGDDIMGEFSGYGFYLTSVSDKKFFSKVDTEIVINSAYKPNDPKYANLTSLLSWDSNQAAGRKPTGTIKYTVGGGTCELNLTTNNLSCNSTSHTKTDVGGGYRFVFEKMLLADSSADRVTAEYSGDAVFNPSTSVAVLFKTVDTEIRIRYAHLDESKKYASVSAYLDWDSAEDEGLLPTGTIKFVLGNGNCTLTIDTGKIDCVSTVSPDSVSDDRHSYLGKNMRLSDSSAEIVSVEYSGDSFFNPSKSKQQEIDDIFETTIVISAEPEKYCDHSGHCFVNFSGTFDWLTDETFSGIPTGTITFTIGGKSLKLDLESGEWTLPDDWQPAETAVRNKVTVEYDKTTRKSFRFTNLLIDYPAADLKIEAKYSGDTDFMSSSREASFVQKKIETYNIFDSCTINKVSYGGSFNCTGKLTYLYDNLPIEFKPSNSFTPNIRYGSTDGSPSYTYQCNMINDDTPMSCSTSGETYNMNWKIKPNGTYIFWGDLFKNTSVDETYLEYLSLTFNGDSLYKSSTAKRDNYTEGDVIIYKIYNLHMTLTGAKDFYVQKNRSEYDPGRIEEKGWYSFITESDFCSLYFDWDTREFGKGPEGSDRKICVYKRINPDVTGLEYNNHGWVFYRLEVGDTSDTSLKVIFEPTEGHCEGGGTCFKYKPSESGWANIAQKDRPSTLTMSSATMMDDKLNVKVKLDYSHYRPSTSSSHRSIYEVPTGDLKITAGNYQCTVHFDDIEQNEYTLGTDCGDSRDISINVAVTSSSESYTSTITIANLPYSDPTAESVKADYLGDFIYQSSSAQYNFSKVTSQVDLSLYNGASDSIYTKISPAAGSSSAEIPTGTVMYNFSPSNTVCEVTASQTGVVIKDCEGGSITDVSVQEGATSYVLTIPGVSQLNSGVSVTYSGDGNYNNLDISELLWVSTVTLTPETDNLYSTPDRLYFNAENSETALYPLFPEEHNYPAAVCAALPSECRTLKHTFQLKVTASSSITTVDMSGERIYFSGDSAIAGASCSLAKISDGVYGCTTGDLSFDTPGKKQIKASYAGNSLKNLEAAEATFPDMYAVSVASTGQTATTTVIETDPSIFKVGDSVTITASAFPSDNPGATITDVSRYVIYAYNRDQELRFEPVCNDRTCTLTVPGAADSIVAEFLGTEQYAPSNMQKEVYNPPFPVTLSVGNLQPVGGDQNP